MALVPSGSDVKAIALSPPDLTSLIEFINRLIGVDVTIILGSTKKIAGTSSTQRPKRVMD
ncbi:MAG: hypothetical protein WA632_12165 [Gallionella sp.]